MNSQYQWAVHGAAAARAGAGQQVLDAIRDDGDLTGLDVNVRIAIAFTRELFRRPEAPGLAPGAPGSAVEVLLSG
jgi:hypothetical protein